MSVCVWRPYYVVIWRISTCFLGAINLQGEVVFLSDVCIKRVVPAILQGVMPSNLQRTDTMTNKVQYFS